MTELADRVNVFWSEENTSKVKAMRERLNFLDNLNKKRAFQHSGFVDCPVAEHAADELYSIFGEKSLGWDDERLLAYVHTQAERLQRRLEMQAVYRD